MVPLQLSPFHRQHVDAEAARAYPHECCGFLIGLDGPAGRRVTRVERADNIFDAHRQHDRFLIDPRQLRAAERLADAAGHRLVGIYHSHPDHPARPSDFDREHAWPYYSYLIARVEASGVAEIRCWQLDETTGQFQEQPIELTAG